MEEPEKNIQFLYACLGCIGPLFNKAKYTSRKYMYETRKILYTGEN